MGDSKAELRGTRWFHNVDPAELDDIPEFAEWLNALLHNPCSIWEENGETIVLEIRQRVELLDGLRIEVYPNEHPPPHFHVRSPNVDASFTIEDCELMSGTAAGADLRKIRHWHRHAKGKLAEAWASSRPTDCTVSRHVGGV